MVLTLKFRSLGQPGYQLSPRSLSPTAVHSYKACCLVCIYIAYTQMTADKWVAIGLQVRSRTSTQALNLRGRREKKSGKATCCAEHGCCSSHGGEQNLLEDVFSRLFRNQEWFFTAVLALLSQAETHFALPCPRTIQCLANLLVKE